MQREEKRRFPHHKTLCIGGLKRLSDGERKKIGPKIASLRTFLSTTIWLGTFMDSLAYTRVRTFCDLSFPTIQRKKDINMRRNIHEAENGNNRIFYS